MNRIRKRFIKGDQTDLTFIFSFTATGTIHKTVIIDNISECDVAIIDLNKEARAFYDEQLKALSVQRIIDRIREQLSKSKEIV